MAVSLATRAFAAAGSTPLGSRRRSHLPVPRSPHVPMRPVPAPGRAGRRTMPGARRRRRRAGGRRGPGALSHFDLARKDCLGTARNTTSKVWFTVADGVLSDVYFPTNDNTNVETLQYIVSDGSSFTDLQTRDTTYTVKQTDDRALTCRVTTTAKSGRYKIVTDYTTDPSRPTVLIRSKFVALKGRLSDYRLYVRHDPTLNGNGGGGTGNAGADDGGLAQAGGHTLLVGSDIVTKTTAANRDYAIPVYSALDVDRGFDQATNGFAGAASDGLKAARREPRAHRSPRQCDQGQRRADRTRPARPSRALHARARLRGQPGRRHLGQPALAPTRLRRRAPRLRAWLERLRRQARQAQATARRLRAALERHPRRVLPQRQLREGGRGQDLPRRRGRLSDLAVGPGGLRRRPGQHLFRLLPRGLRPRPVRGVDGGLPGRRPPDRDGHDALPLRAPAADRRLDAAQQPDQRQARARQLQHAARRVRLPAGHGARRRAHRQRLLQGPHRAGRELRGQPRPLLGPRALGGAERLLALDHLGGDRRARGRGDHRRPQRRPRLRARVARRRRRVPAQPQEVDADHQRAAEPGALLHPPLQERGPQRGRLLQRRQRRPTLDQRDGHRRRLPRVRAARAAVGQRRRHHRARSPSSTRRSSAAPPAATASCATTATATATAGDSATAIRGRPATRATVTRGPCSPASAASTRSTAAR